MGKMEEFKSVTIRGGGKEGGQIECMELKGDCF